MLRVAQSGDVDKDAARRHFLFFFFFFPLSCRSIDLSVNKNKTKQKKPQCEAVQNKHSTGKVIGVSEPAELAQINRSLVYGCGWK